MGNEEEAADMLLYPGPIEEGIVWAQANQTVYRSRKKARGGRSRSQARPPTKRHSRGHSFSPAERRTRIGISFVIYVLLGIAVFIGLLLFINR